MEEHLSERRELLRLHPFHRPPGQWKDFSFGPCLTALRSLHTSTRGTWKVILIHQWPGQVLNFPGLQVSAENKIFQRLLWFLFLDTEHGICSLKKKSKTIRQYLHLLFSCWARAQKWKVWRNLLHHSTEAATFINKSKIRGSEFPNCISSHNTAQVIDKLNQNHPSFQ